MRRFGPNTIALTVLWIFSIMAIAGFATFGVHPELLANFPSATEVYASAFGFFSLGQIWLAFGIFALFLFTHVRTKWLAAFAALYFLSLGSELGGTSVGLPFGAYEYSAILEPKWFGLVPIVIPLSWFYMALPSYLLAGRWTSSVAGRIGMGAMILTIWDLSLDPAMSWATRYWMWETTGPYYGMPWINLFGWFLTGLFLMGGLHLLKASVWVDQLPARWVASFFLANLVLPMGMNFASGLWIAGVAGILTILAGVVLERRVGGATRSASTEDGARVPAMGATT